MTGFDIIGVFVNYCTDNDIVVLMGNEEYQNYESYINELEPDQLVMGIMPFKITPINIKAGKYSGVNFSGRILLGRKLESVGTISSLDETYYQKWVNRLSELTSKIYEIMMDISCAEQVDVDLTISTDMINMYSGNIDFVYADLTIKQ